MFDRILRTIYNYQSIIHFPRHELGYYLTEYLSRKKHSGIHSIATGHETHCFNNLFADEICKFSLHTVAKACEILQTVHSGIKKRNTCIV